jgi:hypothetical protein
MRRGVGKEVEIAFVGRATKMSSLPAEAYLSSPVSSQKILANQPIASSATNRFITSS